MHYGLILLFVQFFFVVNHMFFLSYSIYFSYKRLILLSLDRSYLMIKIFFIYSMKEYYGNKFFCTRFLIRYKENSRGISSAISKIKYYNHFPPKYFAKKSNSFSFSLLQISAFSSSSVTSVSCSGEEINPHAHSVSYTIFFNSGTRIAI